MQFVSIMCCEIYLLRVYCKKDSHVQMTNEENHWKSKSKEERKSKESEKKGKAHHPAKKNPKRKWKILVAFGVDPFCC